MRAVLPYFLLPVWLSVSGQEIAKTESYQSPLYNKITGIALSADGKNLIASDYAGHVFFWGRDGSLRKILRANVLPIIDIAVSADGQHFATVSSSNEVIAWNMSGEKLDYANLDAPPAVVAFASSGDTLLFATRNGLFKGSVKNLSSSVKINNSDIICGDEADNNNFIIAGSGNALNLISAADGRMVSSIASCGKVKKVESNGSLICSLCDDGSVQLFELNGLKLKQVASAKTDMSSASKLIITGDKKILLMDEGKAVMWNPSSGKFYNVNGLPEGMTAFAYSDNGSFYAGNQKGEIVTWSAAAGSEISRNQPQAGTTDARSGYKIEATRAGIPVSVNGRAVSASQSVEVRSSTLDIYVWDDEREDGDTISLNFNGEWILSDFMITGEKKKLSIEISPDNTNYLILYARNLGKFPPNTAVVSFYDGESEKKMTVESDLKRCGAVAFRLKK